MLRKNTKTEYEFDLCDIETLIAQHLKADPSTVSLEFDIIHDTDEYGPGSPRVVKLNVTVTTK